MGASRTQFAIASECLTADCARISPVQCGITNQDRMLKPVDIQGRLETYLYQLQPESMVRPQGLDIAAAAV